MSITSKNKKTVKGEIPKPAEIPAADPKPKQWNIVITPAKAKELDAYLESVPHGVVKNILMFLQSCPKQEIL